MRQAVSLLVKETETLDREVRAIVSSMFPDFDFSVFAQALADVEALFNGKADGFMVCDTEFHDWAHTLNVVLTTARLLHGVHLDRDELSERVVNLALVAALFHDTGFLRRSHEQNRTGASFTPHRVERSLDLLEEYADRQGWGLPDVMDIECMIESTDPTGSPGSIVFTNMETMLAAHVLASAEILTPMADDLYLERLPLLFSEMVQSGAHDFTSEYDLLSQTRSYHSFMRLKLENDLSNVVDSLPAHFQARFGIEQDLYGEAVDRNMRYLKIILEEYGEEFHQALRRNPDRAVDPIKGAA